MIHRYFNIAIRNIWRNKTQSLIGILGLAFGLACFVPALYWLHYETSYDNFYPNSGDIYRIYTVDKQTGKENDLVSGILEKKLHEQFPAISNSTVLFIDQNDCRAEGTEHIRLQTLFTDSTFFSVFPQVIISGDARHPLQVMNSITVTETVAVRLFGDADKAIGQQIKSTTLLQFDPPYTITAVVKDPPPNTNLSFDAILSHEQVAMQKSFVEESGTEIWNFAFLQMYVKLNPHTDVEQLAMQLRDFPKKSYTNADIEIRMLPIKNVRHRINPDVPFTLNFIRLFMVAGILLLFSALFNFINLHLDLFRRRFREWQLRALNGASGSQIMWQMIFELICAIFLSLLPAFLLLILARPFFSGLLRIEIGMGDLFQLFVICGSSIVLLICLISLFLFWRLSRSAMSPQSKGKTTRQPTLQRFAVTLQLAVSVVFIVAALVVLIQMRFVNNKDMGFDKNGILHLSGVFPFIDSDVRASLMNELESIPQIESITDTDFTPQHSVNPFKMTTDVEWDGKMQTENPAFNFITTDSRFAETFRIKMAEGDWLNEEIENKIVLNEEAVRIMGLTNPVGAIIRITLNDTKEYTVIGVVKDFHTLSLRTPILPTIFMTSIYPPNNFYIRILAGQEQEVIQRITSLLPNIDPTFSEVNAVPLYQIYDRLNYSEQAGLQLFSVMAIVCLLISLFGIYAVATAASLRRRKEIAIRKVVGAEVSNIIQLFLHEYTIQVIIACVLALPLSYVVMSQWLQGYAYRTNIPWWLLGGVTSGVIAVVLITVMGQVLKAAHSNPAKVVKSE